MIKIINFFYFPFLWFFLISLILAIIFKILKQTENLRKVIRVLKISGFGTLIIVCIALTYVILFPTSNGNNETKQNIKEEKKVVEKKEKVEEKTTDKKVEEEKDIYKEIEENLKNSFPRITRVSAAESGVVVEAKAQDGFNKKGIVKEVLKDAKRYAKKIDTLYTDNNLKYESLTLQFFFPMTDGVKTENMKIIQLNYDNLGWHPVYILQPFQEAFEEVLK